MQRHVDSLVRSLREFIDQPDYLTLILGGTDTEMVLPIRILSSLDRQDEDNYYLLFHAPFLDAVSWLEEMITSIKIQTEAFNAEVAEQGFAPIPDLPLEAFCSQSQPSERFTTISRHLGTHLPGSGSIVWVLIPSELPTHAISHYRELMDPLLTAVSPEPWINRHRFVLRDVFPSTIIPELYESRNDQVLVMELELGHDQILNELVETMAATQLPADERVMALFQLAAIDFAYKRYDDAIAKYGHAFNYYVETENLAMQALCLNSAGDALSQAGDSARALERYQQSLAVSVPNQNLPVLHAGLYGAGCCCLDLEQFSQAEGYL